MGAPNVPGALLLFFIVLCSYVRAGVLINPKALEKLMTVTEASEASGFGLFGDQIGKYLIMFRILLFVVLLASTDGFVRYRKLLPTLQRCTNSYNQVPRSEIPSRFDTCKVLISGVVGTEPKEIYMKNGHYVVNFAVGKHPTLI